jgi:hypothetical protein
MKSFVGVISKSGFHFILLLVALLCSCDSEDERMPAYLNIATFHLQTSNATWHGSTSHKITNAKVFVIEKSTGKTQSLGVLPLPASVPVLLDGNYELNIDPVIKANGNSLYLQIYPFYERFTTPIFFTELQTVSVSPVTLYKSESKFEFIEGFEGSQHLFSQDRDPNPATFIQISKADVFEGNSSGLITLDTANFFFAAATQNVYRLSIATAGKIFLEANYKTDVPIEFGIITVDEKGVETANFEFFVNPRNEWNKIYFDLTELVNSSNTNKFYIALRTGIPKINGKFTLQKAEVFLDNIKLLHF